MAEYIAREELLAQLRAMESYNVSPMYRRGYDDCVATVLNAPAADVVPVVHAKWIHTKTEEDDWGHSFHHWHCPVCGWFEGSNPEGARKYCSGCGAKMGGVVDNA